MTPEFSATVQTLLLWTLPPLVAALVAYGVRQAVSAWAAFKSTKPDAAWAIEQAVQMGVRAAEQTGLKNQWQGAGQAKYDLAFEIAQNYLAAQGLNINGKLIGSAIEAAVIELFPKAPTA